METRFRSSFIPKNLAENSISSREPGSLMGTLAGLIFLASVLSVGGLFAYKKIVQNSVANLQAELSFLEASVDRQVIDQIISFDKKVSAVGEILGGHVAVSEFFKMLEENTLQKVVFLNFKYSAPALGDISVRMDGEAPSYAVVAEQNRVFLGHKDILSADFNGLSLESEKGQVSFIFDGVFKRGLVAFKKEAPVSNASESETMNDLVDEINGALEDIEADLSDLD